jgi:hypothetical protein
MKNDAEKNFDREAFDKNFDLIFNNKEKKDGNKDDKKSTNTSTKEENND